jgi:carboxypeptidase family protein/TonB-dependent receptor-like protein
MINRFGFISALLLCFATVGVAQTAGGVAGISGTVHDPSGASVPGAKVVVANQALGVARNLTTNDAGLFTAPALTPGTGYSIDVTASGFAGYSAKDLTLQVGQNLDLDVALSVGQTTTEVQVNEAAQLIDDTKTDVSGVINSRQILDLPINGRRVDSFVLLTPGVTNDGTFGLLTFRGVANGNSFLLDGNDSTEQFYVENNGRTRITTQLSQDAVQEFQVVSANFSAEYGRAMGGVVNTVTRSGTNDFHGTGYWFYRNDSMEAHDPFANINPPDSRTQGGASIGGRIIKDKLFYFFNGDFTSRNDPLVDSIIKAGVVDTANQAWIGCGAPATAAQCSAITPLLTRFFGSLPRTVANDLGFGRLDYRFSDRSTFSASLNYMRFNSPNGLQQTLVASTSGAGINSNGNDFSRVRNGRFSWTYVPSSSFVNEFRFGWMTDLEGDNPNNALLGKLGLLDASVVGVQLGAINYLPRVEPNEQRFQFVDNASWTKGRHSVKFGMDIATTEDYSYFIQNLNGSYTYQTVGQFAADYTPLTPGVKNWQSYSQAFGNPTVDASINDYGFYLEDQWRASSRLTVTVGARYEYSQLPQPKVFNHDYPQTGHINSQATNLMPRIGIAYRLNPKTVLRAGFGTFYARVAAATLQDLFTGNGVNTTSISLAATQAAQFAAGPAFPNILSAIPTGASVSATTIQFAAPNWKTPYSEQGTFAVEREVAKDIAVTASYIWSRGVQLYGVRDLNLPTLGTVTKTYVIDDANNNQIGTFTTPVYTGTRPDTRYGGIYQDENGVTSSYNALAVQAQKRFSHGLQADLAYTWSHEIDDGQGYGQATQNLYLSNANAWLLNGNYKADKGNGLEDQRHRFVLAWIWAPTFTHGGGAFNKYVVNNWQLSTITTINSSRPYTSPTIRVTDTPVTGMFSNFTINGSGLSSRVPFLPVDNIYQPALYRADARISKIIPIGDRYKFSVNFEVFNVSNSWSPTAMSSQQFTEAKGVITLTPGAYGVGTSDGLNPDGTQARREQVSLRFVF